MLTEWWGGGEFHRAPASGGLHWASDHRVAGDIIPPSESDFPFVVELKKREGWTIEHILLDIGEPRDWWRQVIEDSRRVKKTPLLMFSRNRAKDFVMVPYDADFYSKLIDVSTDVMVTPVTTKTVRDTEEVFYVIVTTFDTLKLIDKETIKNYANSVDWDYYKNQ